MRQFNWVLYISDLINSTLKRENRILESELEMTKMLLDKCNDMIYGDAFVITRSGSNGYLRLEGYEEAVEYLQACCF